jgi:hypothetical protein
MGSDSQNKMGCMAANVYYSYTGNFSCTGKKYFFHQLFSAYTHCSYFPNQIRIHNHRWNIHVAEVSMAQNGFIGFILHWDYLYWVLLLPDFQ